MKRMKNKLIFIFALVLTLAACSSSKNTTSIIEEGRGYGVEYSEALTMEAEIPGYKVEYDADVSSIAGIQTNMTQGSEVYYNDAAGVLVDMSKIIMTGDIFIETDNFDIYTGGIRDLVTFYNGYTSSSNIYQYSDNSETLRRYKAILKIPAENFNYAFDNIKSMDGTKSASQYQENVSEQYSNTESRLATRKIEEERILGMIAKTSEVNELLSLERRLSQVRTDISLYEAQIKNIDKLVAYSTINITVNEVAAATAKSNNGKGFLNRVIGGFKDSIRWILNTTQAITFVVAASILPLSVFAVIILIIFFIVRKTVKRDQ